MIGARRVLPLGLRSLAVPIVLLLLAGLAVAVGRPAPARAAVPSGFTEVTAFSGLLNPTNIRFAPDGRIFVAEKRGEIQVFDGIGDTTPTTVVDLRTEVYNYWDRGLLGLAIDPQYPTRPYLYALYTYDGNIGGPAPKWGTPATDGDPCPSPPGPTTDGCVASGKLVKLTVDPKNPSSATTTKQDLINDWCQQYPSHSTGDLLFGRDGALYASAGDAASFDFADYGQAGNPVNPCGDPPAEGGALRAQDLRTTADPTSLDGTVIRVNPDTGQALADNPNVAASDPNARRIVAHGLRNPFRMTQRPGTDELWIGDVGWNTWEEINRLQNPKASLTNFGWPCYEGNDAQPSYANANLSICQNLYSQGNADTKPYYPYRHGQALNSSDNCATGNGSSVSGLSFQFYSGGPYPAEYDGALFVSDYSRNCIWVMTKGTDGLPDKLKLKPFVSPAAGPVDLELSPQGELFYADLNGGTVKRIVYSGTSPTSCPSGQYLAEYFNNMTLSGSPATAGCEPAPLSHDWGTGSPSGVGPDNWSGRWTGNFAFPAAGTYTFTAVADDGIRVWVDGNVLIDQWRDQSATTYTATPSLTAGTHAVKVEWYDHGFDAVAKVSWAATNPTSCASGQYLAEYFNNMTLSGTATTTGCEPAPLNHDWAAGSPSGVGADNWSARWTGTFDFPSAGSYTFTAVADDGIRVWVDGSLLVDQWRDQSATTYTATRSLAAGSHVVKVEWYENLGDAVAKVSWAAPAGPSPPVPTIATPAAGTTWKVGDFIAFSGSATDPQDGTLPASALSWRLVLQHCPSGSGCHSHELQTWTGVSSGSFSAPDHEYPSYLELSLTATDSSGTSGTVTRRLDPQTVTVTMASQPAGLQLTLGAQTAVTPFTGTLIAGGTSAVSAPSPQTLSGTSYGFGTWSDNGAATHNITVGASAVTYTATYAPAGCPAGQYRAEYFANRTVSGTPVSTGCQANPLNLNWGNGGPPGAGNNNFSVRFTGTFSFPGGNTTFTAAADDGVRVWLDGTLIVDRWTRGVGTTTVTRSVPAGAHTVRVEYFEKTGSAYVRTSWQPV